NRVRLTRNGPLFRSVLCQIARNNDRARRFISQARKYGTAGSDDGASSPVGFHFVTAERSVAGLCLWPWVLVASLMLTAADARAESCPKATDEIATDRPDVTNSSLVVPTGSLQNENGVNFSIRDDGRTIDGTDSRWRLGIAPCFEVLVDLPTYFASV